jgi:hypothetical protein
MAHLPVLASSSSKRTTLFFLLSSCCLLGISLGFSVPPAVVRPSSHPQAYHSQQQQQQQQRNPRQVVLFANKEEKLKGVYVRPSGAIERGSGFFVPGLEGPRVRLLFGIVLLGLTGINHVLAASSLSLSLEESIAILYSLLVLFQAAIEFEKEELIVEGGNTSSTINTSTSSSSSSACIRKEDCVQQWSTMNDLSQDYKSRVQWSAASPYLAVTPAAQMMLLQNDSIVYRLGGEYSATTTNDDDDKSAGIQAALEQVRQSKGGRIALPLTHPAVVALCSSSNDSNDDTRTVILQQITDDSCWMMTSDQLLASFTKEDLKWLGQLANYINVV